MSTGYTRQSSSQIASGQEVTSSCFNNEFNQLQSAFGSASGHAHDGTTGGGGPLSTASLDGLSGASVGIVSVNGNSGFSVFTLAGTSNQITITNGSGAAGTPTVGIAAGYVGQTSITTLGTISSGTWAGNVVGQTHGGTGVNNAGTLTYGANNLTITTSGSTSVTFPTSGTLLSSANNLNDVASQTTALTNILPSQTGNNGKFLTTNGSGTVTWGSVSGASGGTVTSVTFTGDGTVLSSSASSAVTGSGTVTATLATAAAGTCLNNATTSSAAPTYTTNVVHGNPGTTAGSVSIANGSASGANVKIQNLGTTSSAWNFNLPQTAGSSGAVLTSGAGGASNMSWTTLSGSSGISYSAGAITLATMSANSLLGNNTGSSAVPASITPTQALDIIGAVQGDILYRSASAWSVLGPGSSGQFLKTQGASANPIWATNVTGIGKVSVQTFTSSGTYTPTSGTTYAMVELVGGGGGCGGVQNSSSSGGGSGGYAKVLLTAAQIGASQTITIGAAGAAGSAATGAGPGNGSTGGTGGTTSIGTLVSCAGGAGGSTDAQVGGVGQPGGTGGAVTVSTGTALLTIAGQAGGIGTMNNYASAGMQYGGSGGSNPLGFGGAATTSAGGFGGTPTNLGTAGSGFGGGASGSADSNNTSTAGVAGAKGVFIVTEFQ